VDTPILRASISCGRLYVYIYSFEAGLFFSRYCAKYSTGFGGLSFTSCERPCSRIGTTVESKYARIGNACCVNLLCTAVAAFSAAAPWRERQEEEGEG
jgi:hypothetical protein